MGFKYKGIGHAYREHVYKAMQEIATAMIRYMESDSRIPIDTHNLKDALGVGIYRDGVLTSFNMPQKAQVPRTNIGVIGGENHGTLWGANAIADLMQAGATKYSFGYNLVLFSAMPYDVIQDSQGINRGWFSQNLTSEFESLVQEITLKYGGIEYEII